MNKRFVIEISSLIILFLGIILFYYNFRLIALLLYLIWYLIFGMVGLAFYCSTHKKIKMSNFFLAITIPVILLPSRKAFYYWTKAVNSTLADSARASVAYDLAMKVNPDNLLTDNNRCMYFSFVAALLFDTGEKERALHFLALARQFPHKTALDAPLQQLSDQFSESNE